MKKKASRSELIDLEIQEKSFAVEKNNYAGEVKSFAVRENNPAKLEF